MKYLYFNWNFCWGVQYRTKSQLLVPLDWKKACVCFNDCFSFLFSKTSPRDFQSNSNDPNKSAKFPASRICWTVEVLLSFLDVSGDPGFASAQFVFQIISDVFLLFCWKRAVFHLLRNLFSFLRYSDFG